MKYTIIALLFASSLASASQPTDHIVVAPVKAGAPTIVSEELWIGSKIYERAFGRGCGACHDMSTNPDLLKVIQPLTETEFTGILTNGQNGMPAAIAAIMQVGVVKKAKLSETEAVDALYDYLSGRATGDIPEGKLTKQSKRKQ